MPRLASSPYETDSEAATTLMAQSQSSALMHFAIVTDRESTNGALMIIKVNTLSSIFEEREIIRTTGIKMMIVGFQ
jgi:hypothetical protein